MRSNCIPSKLVFLQKSIMIEVNQPAKLICKFYHIIVFCDTLKLKRLKFKDYCHTLNV